MPPSAPAIGPRTRRSWHSAAVLAIVLALTSPFLGTDVAHAQATTDSRYEGSARELEQRLLAPCCWNQTLDVHESPLASSLRSELRTRLRAGESPQQIEDGLAQRFGERVRAVPRGRDTRLAIVVFIALAMLASAIALVALARRWARRPISEPGTVADGAAADPYDVLLDRELLSRDA